jgi:hypothetical protein
MKSTKDADVRAQQRAIPPFVDWLLDEFGEEEHDGRGCVRVYFTRRSVRTEHVNEFETKGSKYLTNLG